jgi:hypothetical protein
MLQSRGTNTAQGVDRCRQYPRSFGYGFKQVLQRIRAILSESAHMVIEQPLKKTFESEGAILERTLAKCIRDRQAALKALADAARRVDKAAFGQEADFGPSHQALLRALDRAADFI